MLNAVEPGTVVPIHRRLAKDECFVVLRGKVGVTTHDDDGAVIGYVVLSWESGGYGVDVSKNLWHMVEALVLGSVVFECKEGPFAPHDQERMGGVNSVKMNEINLEGYRDFLFFCDCAV